MSPWQQSGGALDIGQVWRVGEAGSTIMVVGGKRSGRLRKGTIVGGCST